MNNGTSGTSRRSARRSIGYSVDLVAAAPIGIAWDVSVPADPTRFYPKFGPLPAVIEVRDQSGPWDAVAQTRRLMLSDGGHVIEHIREVRPREFFAYELTDFQKLFGRLVGGARAEWTYTEVAGGTRIRWSYAFYPQPRSAIIVGAIVRLFWAPYMRRVLPGIVRAVEQRA